MDDTINKLTLEVIADFQYDLHKCKTTANLQKRVKALIDDLVTYAYPGFHAEILPNSYDFKDDHPSEDDPKPMK